MQNTFCNQLIITAKNIIMSHTGKKKHSCEKKIVLYSKNSGVEFQKKDDKDIINVISNIYNYLSDSDSPVFSGKDISASFAVKLAKIIIEHISSSKCIVGKHGFFTVEFYDKIMIKSIKSPIYTEIEDPEIFTIYVKQTVALLKKTGIIRFEGKYAVTSGNISDARLFTALFNSLWNDIEWETIFPSDANAAIELRRNRLILKDLILKQKKAVELDHVANEFFDLTGFSEKNDLLMISFMDFYIFAWLKNFGLVRYIEKSSTSPVYIEVTDLGQRVLKHLS